MHLALSAAMRRPQMKSSPASVTAAEAQAPAETERMPSAGRPNSCWGTPHSVPTCMAAPPEQHPVAISRRDNAGCLPKKKEGIHLGQLTSQDVVMLLEDLSSTIGLQSARQYGTAMYYGASGWQRCFGRHFRVMPSSQADNSGTDVFFSRELFMKNCMRI